MSNVTVSVKEAEYMDWLSTKTSIKPSELSVVVENDDIHESSLPHQYDIIKWMMKKGKALLGAQFGLGKTHVQCEVARLVHEETGGRFLQICPLGVRHQFTDEDGPRLGIEWQYVTSNEEVEAATTPYLITNYERVRDGAIDPALFDGVSLDEGSVLRSLGSKTYDIFIQMWSDTPFRFVSTATPSPNRIKELIHYAEFLGVMDRGQALTRFFKRDSQKAGNLTLHPHHEKEFWLWVSTWALFVQYPSDLGYSDEGYVLPELKVEWHRLACDHTRVWDKPESNGQIPMIASSSSSIQAAAREKRDSIDERIDRAMEIMAESPDDHYILWHHLEDERTAIEKLVPDAVTVYGSQSVEDKESKILGFAHGEFPILATKPEIAGSGCNFQHHCHKAIFIGANYKFQDFIQAVYRIQRFRQAHQCEVHIIYMDSEDGVISELKRKWAEHDALIARMRGIVKKYGLIEESLSGELTRSLGVKRQEETGKFYQAIHNDCIIETKTMEDDSIDLVHTSIPFGNHYEYSESMHDMGFNEDNKKFFEQMDYLVPELLRILKPGRVAAIHVKDRIRYGNMTGTGFPTVDRFSDQTADCFEKHGFHFFGRITIMTDVVRENNQTYRLGYSEMCKDSTKMGVGMPEYLLLFRKLPTDTSNAYADEPVTKEKFGTYTLADWQMDAHSFWRSSGNRLLTTDEMMDMPADKIYRWFREWSASNSYSHDDIVAIAKDLEERGKLPKTFMMLFPQSWDQERVWTDVTYMRTLNANQSQKRQENHICPLPIDIVNRTIERYSMKGETVFDPFGGIGTVPYRSVQLGRNAISTELNESYWLDSLAYMREAEIKRSSPTLFDLLDFEQHSKAEPVAA